MNFNYLNEIELLNRDFKSSSIMKPKKDERDITDNNLVPDLVNELGEKYTEIHGAGDRHMSEYKLNPNHNNFFRDCVLHVKPLSPYSSTPDTEISPGEVLAPCSLLPEEHYIMSPTITDSQFSFLETAMTEENTATTDGAIHNARGAGMTNIVCDTFSAEAAGEDTNGQHRSKFSQLVGYSDPIHATVSSSDDGLTLLNNNNYGTKFETRSANDKCTLETSEHKNRDVHMSVSARISPEKTDLKNSLPFCLYASDVSNNERQQKIKQRAKTLGSASLRNQKLLWYKDLPNRPTNYGLNSPNTTNNSMKRAFNEDITDLYKIKQFSLRNQNRIGTLNESFLEEQEGVQDEMMTIIKELRRISEGQSPMCQTNVQNVSVPRDNMSYEMKCVNLINTGGAERKQCDSLRELSPINEQVDPEIETLQSNNTMNGDSNQNSIDDLPSHGLSKIADMPKDYQSSIYTFDTDNITELHQNKRTFPSEVIQKFESPSRKRVSFYLDDDTPDVKCSQVEDQPIGKSTSFINNIINTDKNKLTALKVLNSYNDMECSKTQLKRFYSLSEEKENDQSDDSTVKNSDDMQMKRTQSLPAQVRDWRQADDQSKLCNTVWCDANTHEIPDNTQLLKCFMDGQSILGFTKSTTDVGSETEKQLYEINDNDGYDSNEGKNTSSNQYQCKPETISYQGKGNLSPTHTNNTTSGQIGHKHTRQLKWFSLDEPVESTPLATSFLRPAPKTASGAVGNHRFSFEPEDILVVGDNNNDLCPNHDMEKIGIYLNETDENNGPNSYDRNDSGPVSNADHCETSPDIKEEDTLSLEFFLPVKKQYIRLHRSTFIGFILKYSIFLLTFIFWVASITGIAFGVWMLLSNKVFIDDITDLFLDPYVLLSFVAGIIFLISFFGCVGALRENILLLTLFYITLTVVLVMEGLMSTLVFLFYTMPEFRQAVKVGPEEVLKRAVKDYFDNDGIRHWIDTVQKEFQCCGVSMSNSGYLDWQENIYFNCSKHNPSVYRCSVPLSCCIFEPGEYINYRCGADIMNKEESYILHMINTKGCMKSFGEWLGKNDIVIGYVALGVIIPQILGVVAARFFVRHLRRHSTNWRKLSDTVQITS